MKTSKSILIYASDNKKTTTTTNKQKKKKPKTNTKQFVTLGSFRARFKVSLNMLEPTVMCFNPVCDVSFAWLLS